MIWQYCSLSHVVCSPSSSSIERNVNESSLYQAEEHRETIWTLHLQHIWKTEVCHVTDTASCHFFVIYGKNHFLLTYCCTNKSVVQVFHVIPYELHRTGMYCKAVSQFLGVCRENMKGPQAWRVQGPSHMSERHATVASSLLTQDCQDLGNATVTYHMSFWLCYPPAKWYSSMWM